MCYTGQCCAPSSGPYLSPLSSEGMNSALCLDVKSSAAAQGQPVSLLLDISVVFSSPGISQRIIGKY